MRGCGQVSVDNGRRGSSIAEAPWRILLLACLCGAAISVAAAQEAPAPASNALEEVVVTGSRIAAPNEVSTSPIQVISSESLRVTGRTDVSDVLNQLPQNFTNDLGQDLGNGTSGLTAAGGVATADLRGLGPNRTLVLIDGRRLGIGSPNTAIKATAPDLDQIPAGLIDRVEVVTGGASATYGSDAVAGVVNFIMKRNFEGLQLDAQLDTNWHHEHDSYAQGLVREFGSEPATGTQFDGRQRTFDLIAGSNFADKTGNITAYLSYRHADPLASAERDFGGCQLNPDTDAAGNVTGLVCGGSSNSNWFQPVTGPNSGSVYNVSGSSLVPSGSVPGVYPPPTYNSQRFIYMTRENDRYNAAVLAHKRVADFTEPYAEFFFMNDRSTTRVAPSALFKQSNPLDPTGRGDYYVNCSNPLLSAQEQAVLCTPAQVAADAANPGSQLAELIIGRRNLEGGPRQSEFQHDNYRAVVGSRGDLGDAWKYDAYFQYYYVTFYNANQKYLSYDRIGSALIATGSAAKPTCVNKNAIGCVPYNLWSTGGVTPDQLAYLYVPGTGDGSSTLRTLHAEVTGQLGQYGLTSPLARDGVAVNLGWEHRNERQIFAPDAAELSGLLSGFGGSAVPIDASESVNEQFLELRAPLVQGRAGARDLVFDAAVRRSDYHTSGVVNTYKFEVQYSPVEDFRLRASYDRAIRAPSIVELFSPPNVTLITFGADPCAPAYNSLGQLVGPATFSLAQCMRTGVTAAQYGNGFNTNTIPQGTAFQLAQEQSGNPDLKPERAGTYTVGVNFSPSLLPRLTGSIDYYHIQVRDTVGVIPPSLILNTCANTGDPAYCSQLVRSPSNGGLQGTLPSTGGFFVQKLYNLGTSSVSGIDLQLNYRHDLPGRLGAMRWDFNGAYLQHTTTQPLSGAHTYDCAGYFGFTCQTVNPHWRHNLRATWDLPRGLSATVTWRFIGPASNDNNSADPSLHFNAYGAYDFYNARIPGYSYLDLAATWSLTDSLTLRAGINNVTDRDPPIVDTSIVGSGVANTYTTYDLFGRQLFLAVSAKF